MGDDAWCAWAGPGAAAGVQECELLRAELQPAQPGGAREAADADAHGRHTRVHCRRAPPRPRQASLPHTCCSHPLPPLMPAAARALCVSLLSLA
eukprot:3896299-Rhodomonas_salina.3